MYCTTISLLIPNHPKPLHTIVFLSPCTPILPLRLHLDLDLDIQTPAPPKKPQYTNRALVCLPEQKAPAPKKNAAYLFH